MTASGKAFSSPAMDTRYSRHRLASPTTVPKQDEPPDFEELSRGNSDATIKYPFHCMGIRWLTQLARGCFSYTTDYVAMADAED
uniref:Uncharacterized protein n=1 Tax=Echinococcus granulosus TaxID=6210 RepID=A0A068WBG1_ECHGR|nr:hypothetical protein EgrG_002012100 [Echinococcus granulosus]